MKKKLITLFCMMLAFGLLTACGDDSENGKYKVVTTIFPVYDWTKNIAGKEDVGVSLLMNSGVDLHSYQPSADDIAKISSCDVFIYVGGESDAWVDDALKQATNKDMIVINLMDSLGSGVKEEEMVEGMEPEEDEEDVEEADEEEDDEPEYDEHVWLSLQNAMIFCDDILAALETVDPEHAEAYESNAEAYYEKLDELDSRYYDVIGEAENDTLVFADRFPFRYLTDDYGLEYYAAFAGCSAETEASFDTIVFLAKKADELGTKTILTIESGDQKIAKTVIDNMQTKDVKIAALDSLQSATSKSGTSYLKVMEENLKVIEQALK
ncbi:MAG: metal ABC transporter substrate-binding protein [Lachnospiraceae bacterium]|nr:metal ABC transporter substrate-binding protein [Lachnospiraceae bacterium]